MQWVQQLVLSKLLSNALQAMRCRQCGGILVANARAQRRVFAPVVPPSRVPSDSKPMPPPSTVRRRIIWNAAVLALVTLIGAVTHYSLGVVTRLEAHRPTAVASSTQRLGSLPASIASPPQAIAPSPFPPPTAPPHAAAEPCNPREHTELWGEVVQWGTPQPSAEACCAACREYEPTVDVLQGAQCNTWVWHPNTSACWLKNQKDLSSAPNTGTHVPWTAGIWTGTRTCVDCELPARFVGCVTKTACNTSRACGSPAVDAYAHVEPDCLERSPTAVLYLRLLAEGTPLVPFVEERADYDGLAVRWGIGNKKSNANECQEACRRHTAAAMTAPRSGPFSRLPCNTWTWCGRDTCWEPDAHTHTRGDCWLKFAELPQAPEVNMREPMLPRYLRRHAKEMADGVPWTSGVLLPPHVPFTNGTWSARAFW